MNKYEINKILIDLETSSSIFNGGKIYVFIIRVKYVLNKALGRNNSVTHRGELDLSHLKLTSDGNPTFVIGDPMNKVHMGKNKSRVKSANTKFNLICPIFPMVYLRKC